jgi:hypothetical protein
MKKISKQRKQMIFNEIKESNPDALFADGLSDAIIGIAVRFGKPPLVAYSVSKILEILHTRDGMTYAEATEFYDFNIVGAWLGEGTPIFIEDGTI